MSAISERPSSWVLCRSTNLGLDFLRRQFLRAGRHGSVDFKLGVLAVHLVARSPKRSVRAQYGQDEPDHIGMLDYRRLSADSLVDGQQSLLRVESEVLRKLVYIGQEGPKVVPFYLSFL